MVVPPGTEPQRPAAPPAACERCGRRVGALDLVRVPAGASWSPRRLDVCPGCAQAVRTTILAQRIAIAIAAGLAVTVLALLLALTL